MPTTHETTNRQKFGWRVDEWKDAVGVGHTMIFQLLRERKIQSVKAGGRRLILTHPADFLNSLKEEA